MCIDVLLTIENVSPWYVDKFAEQVKDALEILETIYRVEVNDQYANEQDGGEEEERGLFKHLPALQNSANVMARTVEKVSLFLFDQMRS